MLFVYEILEVGMWIEVRCYDDDDDDDVGMSRMKGILFLFM